MARHAIRNCSFMLRPKHLTQVAAILDDPNALKNDRYVAQTLLRNAEASAQGIFPFCQDTGTATGSSPRKSNPWGGGMPSLPPGPRHRRNLGGSLPQYRQTRVNKVPRRTRHQHAPSRSILPGRYRCFLLGGSQHSRANRQAGSLARTTRDRPRTVHSRHGVVSPLFKST